MKNCFLLALLTSFAACSSSLKKEPNVLIIGNGDDVMVTLSIVDNKNIDKIEFYSGHESISVGKKEILKNDEFIFNFNYSSFGS